MNDYEAFIESKARRMPKSGHEPRQSFPFLYPFQADIVQWAVRMGRACIFADCGLGKTPMQLAWASEVPGNVLILAPLAVSAQTVEEGRKFGIPVNRCDGPDDVVHGINITNYERFEKFDIGAFDGIVLDESSILKSYSGAFRNLIIERCAGTRYKLACTATPAPNDIMELGNHAEFVGAMTRTEMLSMFFVHDGGETQKWRLKGHARGEFWRWACSWAVSVGKPSDLGHDDAGFNLPPCEYHEHVVDAEPLANETLFDCESPSLHERRRARRESMSSRVEASAELVRGEPGEQWLIWCDLNDESSALADAIPGAVEVRGSDSPEHKTNAMMGFAHGDVRVLVTKPKIAGFGMNWQKCARMVFVGLSDSYEALYQATRRCWRFGQKRPVVVHIVTAETEGAVLHNVKRKERMAEEKKAEMVERMSHEWAVSVDRGMDVATPRDEGTGTDWRMVNGDCVDVVRSMDDDSIDFSVFSPPFASLYTYSDSARDMGNCRDHDEFAAQFAFLVAELLRVTKPGRLVSFHCMNLPTSKVRDGVIGLSDFRGRLIQMFEDAGWIYHSEVCIWKDPVTSMQRTKALGLLHKTIRKDSSMSRQGIPDYLVTMRKPGENPDPIAHTSDEFPVELWQRWASPVWMDINPSDTLQRTSAREEADERHICPLQLEVIRRALGLWTKPGDLVLSPFAGIGSEGFEAIKWGRKFVGIELKRSYWEQACRNLASAELSKNQLELFA